VIGSAARSGYGFGQPTENTGVPVDRCGARRLERDVPSFWGETSVPIARAEATWLERLGPRGEAGETQPSRTDLRDTSGQRSGPSSMGEAHLGG